MCCYARAGVSAYATARSRHASSVSRITSVDDARRIVSFSVFTWPIVLPYQLMRRLS